MKHARRKSHQLMRIAAAGAIALTSQFAVDVARAGSGVGSGVTLANSPVSVPNYFANSPSGPAPTWVNGVLQLRTDGSALPVTGTSGSFLRKFVDTLPGFGSANANDLGQYIPVAVPEKWVDPNGVTTTDDYYEIAAVEFSEQMHKDLPKATHLRGYVQLETPGNAGTSKHVPLYYPVPAGAAAGTAPAAITDPAKVTTANPTGQVFAYDNPHHLGPVITATKGTAVRVKFTNYLPVGGKLFLPLDTTIPGAGLGPDGVTSYTQNRAGMHLVGGEAPWVSAGTPHQWVAPAGETAEYAAGMGKGVSARNAPDTQDPGNGSINLYFPNDMSARFTFIQDRTSGMTRLNAYAGLEAGYVVTDPIEQALVNGGTLTGGGLGTKQVTIAAGTLPAATIPLIIEDKSFVPANIAQQDALWDTVNWGAPGDLWFPHVYQPNQDPAMANGVNPVGRWDYGPLFWPIFPISPAKATLPSPSFTPEAYLDTPLVNGTAYPTVAVEPKAYRLRILNASNDRYYNLGLYVADPTLAPLLDQNGNPVVNAAGVQQTFLAGTEVRMVPAAGDAAGNPAGWSATLGAQLPQAQFGTTFGSWHIHAEPSGPSRAWPVDARAGGAPDPATSGPDFVVIGNDGGLLPQAADIPSQPITYEQNRRSITVTNIYGYGLLVGPSERADTIVDFSGFAGQTLILFNDAPAPTPFNDPRNDYYTGDPDQTALGGAYSTQPGYGPNTRTIMQIKVGAAVTSGGPLNAAALAAALPAAYAAAQPAPIVPETVYNAAFGTTDTDNYAHVATGSAAQPNLVFTHSGQVTLTGFSLITSGGAGTGSGSGYVTPPQVVLTGGGGAGATATAAINAAGQVSSVTLNTAGSGYTSAPTVTFVSGNTVSGVTVADGGSGYKATDAVTFTGGGGTGAAATLTVSTGSSISTTLVAFTGGSGYTLPPTVSFTGVTGGSGAIATTTLASSTLVATSNSAIGSTAVTVNSAGSGYTNPTAVVSAPQVAGTTATASPVVGFAVAPIVIAAGGIYPSAGGVFDGPPPPAGLGTGSTVINFSLPQLPGGQPPVATVTVDPIFGSVTGITFTSYGSGYTAPPTAIISDSVSGMQPNVATVATTLAAGTGQIYGVNILTAGSGYTAPATITFTDATGTGGNATAAVVGPNNTVSYAPVGSVNSLKITSGGGAYTGVPNVVFTDTVNPNHSTGASAGASAATATVALSTALGAITGITMTNHGTGYTSAPAVGITTGTGTGANVTAGLTAAGVGAQATVTTSTSASVPVLTKAEQELFDDWGRYNSTAGVELPFTTATVQTTIPLNYIDAPTDIIGDGEMQIWKLVDNGFWSNSIHFNMVDVQLINRVGWDGTVKPPATEEIGWKDTLRLNPLEDVVVAMRGKAPSVPFGQPRSARLEDPSKPAGTANFPTAPALPVAGTQYASGLGFTADPGVVSQAGLMAASVVPVGTQLLPSAATNTGAIPGSPTGNYDNEFAWGSAILGHSEDDFTRPVVFNPLVLTPSAPTNLADPLGIGTLQWTDPTPAAQLASAPGVTPILAATLGNPQNEIGFELLQAPVTNLTTGALGAFTAVATPFATVPANVVNYKEPAALVAPNLPQYYAYQVVAYNAAGASAPSNIVVEAPPAAPTVGSGIALLTPTFITPATTTSDVKLTLQWQDNAVNETNYLITRTGGPGAALANGKVTGGAVTTLTAPPNPLAISTNTVYVDPTPLVEGSPYEYDIVASNSFGVSTPVLTGTLTAPISVPLAPTIQGAVSTIAACPTAPVVPVRCKPDDIVLTWVDNAFNETSYTISRTGGAVPFTTVTLPGTMNNAGAVMTYTDHTAQEGVAYTYTVSAVNSVGSGSASASATDAPTAPTLPTNLVVTPSTAVSATGTYVDTATLTWSDNAYNEVTYQVLRDGVPVGAAIVGAGAANNPMGTATAGWTASPVLTYTDTGLIDGTTHTWAVQAANNAGTTTSAPVTATMPGIVITPPVNLIATPNRAASSIGLQWTDMSTNETDFLVEESVSATGGAPGSFSNWTALPPVTRTAAQTAATGGLVNLNRANVPTTPGYVYTFRVSARNLAARSDSHPYLYAQASLLGPVLTTAPVLAVPTVSATGRVTLTWTAVVPPAGTTISYLVNVNGVPVATNRLTYSYRPTLAALQAGLSFSVQAVATAIRGPNPTAYGSTTGPASNVQTVTSTAPAAPAVPAGLTATIAPATGAVTLNWTPVTPAAGTTISYLVSVNNAAGVPMARGALLAVATGASYQVSVAAVATALGLSTASAYSAPITVDLIAAAVPSAPATLTVSATALNWTAPATVSANATVTYNVQKSVDAGVTWTTLTVTPITARTLVAASPVGTNYQYRVQAMATRYGLATSAPSAWTTTTFNTAPAASTTPVAALVSTRHISVTWTNVSTNITGFTLQRRLGGGAWTTIAPAPTVTQNGTTYSITDVVAAAGSYTYRLSATSAGGTTANTAASNAVVTP